MVGQRRAKTPVTLATLHVSPESRFTLQRSTHRSPNKSCRKLTDSATFVTVLASFRGRGVYDVTTPAFREIFIMVRRQPYTKVVRSGFARQGHVAGLGDVAFKVFQCPVASCIAWFTVRADDVVDAFDLDCNDCGSTISSGQVEKIFSFETLETSTGTLLGRGDFELIIDEYVAQAPLYKYCTLCSNLKPMEAFGNHSGRATKRQGECKQCKDVYNTLKNGTRIVDQHREASQKRRLYVDIGGHYRIDAARISQNFGGRCFQCSKEVDAAGSNIDHTLPAYYLWPVKTETATLLCKEHNGEKSNRWPSDYYSDPKLRELTVRTGISYEILSGRPIFNPAAIANLRNETVVTEMMAKYAAYPDEIYNLRNRILGAIDFDFFTSAPLVASSWTIEAESRRR